MWNRKYQNGGILKRGFVARKHDIVNENNDRNMKLCTGDYRMYRGSGGGGGSSYGVKCWPVNVLFGL